MTSTSTHALVIASLLAWAGPAAAAGAPQLGGCELFPAAAIFNTPINDTARFPVHGRSTAWKTLIRSDGGIGLHLHLDLGRSDNPDQPDTYWGIPYNVVDGTAAGTDWLPFSFRSTDANDSSVGWASESDCALPDSAGGFSLRRGCGGARDRHFPFPKPDQMKIEGGTCHMSQGSGCPYNDRHLLVVESGACRLWEGYYSYEGRQGWHHSGVAAWNLTRMSMRPLGWTSADAAGLPMLPLLLRADEASSGEIRHALRVTFRNGVMANRYDWPASHQAGLSTAGNIPFGALLRLRADFVIPANWTAQAKAIARAMQVYGIYVADNGSDLYVQGDPNPQWSSNTISQLQGALTLDRFDFVDLSTITSDPKFSPTSYRARW